ncbi:phosphotransferase family protein [Falsibacillus albus]|uniref:Phosphotransferase n=1 Tax=Falsibacillus albus TaxID=2478915 RepID=A0A3L7K6F7_9BACI|nr:phosphotransferase family protein [Falsibacillus albus]RLQ97889.1 phosphotransferase [Falsibacillus albus]
MEHLFDQEWEIVPAGGATGEAFFAKHHEQKLFLKRNSSPFLAVLSAEGIVPKLVWTKRMENGDVITAQHWLNGRELDPEEMLQKRVAKLLNKIHVSKPLLTMLERLGKQSFEPEMMLAEVETTLDFDLLNLPVVSQSISFLQKNIDDIHFEEYVVCHGDVNHNNWLLSDYNQLYLIDWDGAMIADPAIDLGMLLYWYIPEEQWSSWLDQYGTILTDHLRLRMKWYVVSQTLLSIQWHKAKGRFHEMNHWLEYLHSIL